MKTPLERLHAWVDPEVAPTAAALISSARATWSYAELTERVLSLVTTLEERGAGPGVVVAVDRPSLLEQVAGCLAVLTTGATVLPLEATAPKAVKAAMLERAKPSLLLGAELTSGASRAPVDPRAALLLFTSGSTGEPKGVLLGAAGLQANIQGILHVLPIRDCPRTAVVLSLAYAYALVGQVLTTLRAGATVLLLGDLTSPAAQWEQLLHLSGRGLSSVPWSLRRLANAALAHGGGDTVGYVASAGGTLDGETSALVHRAFPLAKRFNQYGLTEASPRVTTIGDADAKWNEHPAGYALPGLELRIERPDGSDAAPGESGEVLVRGPSVMLGYLDSPDATAEVLRPDGFLRTRDVGHLDGAGRLFVHGRSDGVVKCAGERVHVEHVRQTLERGGQVPVAVVARRDPEWEHRLVAFYEAPGPVDFTSAVKSLPFAARPAKLERLAALPRTPQGKLDLKALRALAEGPST